MPYRSFDTASALTSICGHGLIAIRQRPSTLKYKYISFKKCGLSGFT